MAATEPAPLPLPDRLTVHRRIGYLLRELRIARRVLTVVDLVAANDSRGPIPAPPAPPCDNSPA